ncbi:MAG: bifunctional oligoribonuclease/PAP phosphatase NrnA [Firmicutes bacterium]|nr:bifunctional oligoribonuclease/PAP phosphatase NrnA [Bacillota bacterium]
MGLDGSLAAVAAAMRANETFVVTGHVNPDPDCLGSMLAVAWGLERLGKQVTLVSPDPVRPEWRFLPGSERIMQPPAPVAEALVVLDCEPSRTGEVGQNAGRFARLFVLDHHATNSAAGNGWYVDPAAAATGEIVYRLLTDYWDLKLDSAAATNLYAALMTDTGSFRFSNTTASALKVAARLVEAGARPDWIASQVYERASWTSMRLLAKALTGMDRTPDGRIAWITVTRRMLAEAGARDDEADGFVQYPRMVNGVEVALALRELSSGETRVGLRSRGTVDVSRIAQRLGGGGHPRAAGCTLPLPPDAARNRVVAEVIRELDDEQSSGRREPFSP